MLDANIKTQLKAYLEKLVDPIELVASLDDSAKSAEMRGLLEDIASLSDKVSLLENGNDARRPSFTIGKVGEQGRIRFAGLPMGHEFTSLILALLQASGYAPKLADEVIGQIRGIRGRANPRFETYISLSCHNCPDVVQALNTLAALNPDIQNVMIDGALFQDEVNARQIMAVPSVYLNGEPFANGRMSIEEVIAKLDTGAAAREAAKLAEQAPFDVLVVGGGPAGAAAAVYAARKGIRTGVVSRALRRPGDGHPGHREPHLRAPYRRSQAGPRPGGAREGIRGGHHEPAEGRGADSRRGGRLS
jgi:alkyl hydroperoxide reductase subunit F